jgi:thiamine-phosphate pyrophosphorylase
MRRTAATIRGLYAVTPDLADTALLLRKVEAALSGGARLLQYRNKTAPAPLRLAQARALRALCNRYDARLIVNDHVDIARAAAADGVHVGQEDASVVTARAALGEEEIVGVSCYNQLEQAVAGVDHGADYVAFGTFFPSTVKPDAVHAPLELLRLAKQRLSVPLVAIGGITLSNAQVLISAGVDSVAVISALFEADDIDATARAFCNLFAS